MNQGFDTISQGFDAADSAAIAAINEANAAPENSQSAAPVVAEQPQAPVEPSLVNLTDDQLVEILVGGTPTKVKWGEAKNGVMMHADYTRKTQEVASARKELETLYNQIQAEQQSYQEREAKIIEFLKNDQAVEAYLGQIRSAQLAQNPNTPSSDLASIGDVRNLLQQEITKAQEKINQTVDQKVQELEINRAATSIRQELDTVVTSLKNEYPALNAIPGIERILYDEVNKMEPSTPEEAKRCFVSVAKAQVEALDKYYVSQQKTAAVEKQKLVTQGIEPSGPGVLPSKKTYKSFEESDDDTIRQIQALMSS